jgi:membrane protease YdiL (CAAX protease family)
MAPPGGGGPPTPFGDHGDGGEEPEGECRWPAWIAPIGLVAALTATLIGGLIVSIVAAAVAGTELGKTPPGVLLGGTLIQNLAFIGCAVALARLSGPVWAAQFGLRKTSLWWSLLWIFVLYVVFALFTGIWSTLVEIEDDDLLEQTGADDSTLLLVLTALMVCVAAPVFEEVFFRGFFYGALRNWRGVWPAAIISGVLFGGIHVGSSPVGALVPLMVFGIGLALLYEQTGSLLPCIAVHAINNAIAFSVMNDWGWQIPLMVAGSLTVCLLLSWPRRMWPKRPRHTAAAVCPHRPSATLVRCAPRAPHAQVESPPTMRRLTALLTLAVRSSSPGARRRPGPPPAACRSGARRGPRDAGRRARPCPSWHGPRSSRSPGA